MKGPPCLLPGWREVRRVRRAAADPFGGLTDFGFREARATHRHLTGGDVLIELAGVGVAWGDGCGFAEVFCGGEVKIGGDAFAAVAADAPIRENSMDGGEIGRKRGESSEEEQESSHLRMISRLARYLGVAWVVWQKDIATWRKRRLKIDNLQSLI